jgi:hypothetical protein
MFSNTKQERTMLDNQKKPKDNKYKVEIKGRGIEYLSRRLEKRYEAFLELIEGYEYRVFLTPHEIHNFLKNLFDDKIHFTTDDYHGQWYFNSQKPHKLNMINGKKKLSPVHPVDNYTNSPHSPTSNGNLKSPEEHEVLYIEIKS